MTVRFAIALVAFAAVVGVSAVASADREKSLEIYREGKARYDAGDFAAAIELFERAHAEHPAPAYLFNIAQAYRAQGDCKDALAYYRRFLDTGPAAEHAATVEGHVAELEAECGSPEPAADAGPRSGDGAATDAEPTGEVGAASEGGGGAVSGDGGAVDRRGQLGAERGERIVARVEGGAAFFSMGDVVVPVSATLRLGLAYPLELGPLSVEVGVGGELSAMPYRQAEGDSTALFTTLLIEVAARYPVAEGVRVGGELGIGALSFSGLEAGNPFIEGAMAQADTARTLAVRIGAAAELELGGGLAVTASPAFVYAGADEQLREPIDSVSRFEILAGVRYRR